MNINEENMNYFNEPFDSDLANKPVIEGESEKILPLIDDTYVFAKEAAKDDADKLHQLYARRNSLNLQLKDATDEQKMLVIEQIQLINDEIGEYLKRFTSSGEFNTTPNGEITFIK